MANGKVTIILLTVGLIQKIQLHKISYFSLPHTNKNKTEVKLDLSNNPLNSYLKNARGVDTSQFAKKDDVANLKSEINKLDIAKLETAPAELSKLSNVVENVVVEKAEYNELAKKLMVFRLLILVIQLKKSTMTQKVVKLKRKHSIIIMINILLLVYLIS